MLSWCFPALLHPEILLTNVFEDGQLSSHTQYASVQKLQQGFVGTLQTYLSKDNPDTVEAFEMAGLDVAGSQICQEVLPLTYLHFPNLLFFWQIYLSKNTRNSETAFQIVYKSSHTFKREFVSLYICHYGMINL